MQNQRTKAIEKEIKRLKEARRQKRKRKKPKPAHVPPPHDKGDDSDEDHDTDMAYPPTSTLPSPPSYLCRLHGYGISTLRPSRWDLCSPKEFYLWTQGWDWTQVLGHFLPEHFLPPTDTLANCPQHIRLDTQHLLYENPQPTSLPQTIEVLHDTGASISMLPADFSSAWTNVRPSLHRLSGCLKGGEQQDNEIGEFHALITLDSGETQRAIIPEAILVPSHKTIPTFSLTLPC
jgi:hypothetical protein